MLLLLPCLPWLPHADGSRTLLEAPQLLCRQRFRTLLAEGTLQIDPYLKPEALHASIWILKRLSILGAVRHLRHAHACYIYTCVATRSQRP